MTVNHGVLGSSPRGGAKSTEKISIVFNFGSDCCWNRFIPIVIGTRGGAKKNEKFQ